LVKPDGRPRTSIKKKSQERTIDQITSTREGHCFAFHLRNLFREVKEKISENLIIIIIHQVFLKRGTTQKRYQIGEK
jgi:hypothetical protein